MQGIEVDVISSLAGELYVGVYNIEVIDGKCEMRVKGNPSSEFGYMRDVEITPAAGFAETLGGGSRNALIDGASQALLNARAQPTADSLIEGDSQRLPTIANPRLAGMLELSEPVEIDLEQKGTRIDGRFKAGDLDLIFADDSLELSKSKFGF